jgi:hypothetical protein
MAKRHRRHHRRHSRRFSGFGEPLNALKASFSGMDALLGVAVGFGGIVAAKWALKTMTPAGQAPPAMLDQFAPLLGGLAGGLVAYVAGKKFLKASPGKAAGLLVGAVGAGAAVTASNYLHSTQWGAANYSTYADFGVIESEPGQLSAMVNEPGQLSEVQDDTEIALNQLAAINMGDEDEIELDDN